MFDGKLTSGKFLDSIQEILENIKPTKTLEDNANIKENEWEMKNFHEIDMSELRKIIEISFLISYITV